MYRPESGSTGPTPRSRARVDEADQVDQDDAPLATVVTVSDRSAQGVREDRSGARAQELLEADGWRVCRALVPDQLHQIRECLEGALRDQPDLIVTTGGTGVSGTDITPEATRPFLEKELPGIAEGIRAAGAITIPTAMLSRGLAGMHGHTLLVNLAGSVGAVEDGLAVVLSVAHHAIEQAQGKDHD